MGDYPKALFRKYTETDKPHFLALFSMRTFSFSVARIFNCTFLSFKIITPNIKFFRGDWGTPQRVKAGFPKGSPAFYGICGTQVPCSLQYRTVIPKAELQVLYNHRNNRDMCSVHTAYTAQNLSYIALTDICRSTMESGILIYQYRTLYQSSRLL